MDDKAKLPSDTVKVSGFSESTMSTLFQAAGFIQGRYTVMPGEVEMRPKEAQQPVRKKVFLARASKRAAL